MIRELKLIREKGGTCSGYFPFFRFNLVRNMEEDNKLQTFTLQMQLPAPNLEVAKRVADEAPDRYLWIL